MPKTIIFGEHHQFPIIRTLVHDNLAHLQKNNYTHFGFEHDNDRTLDFEIDCLVQHIQDMDRLVQEISDVESYLKIVSLEKSKEKKFQNKKALAHYESALTWLNQTKELDKDILNCYESNKVLLALLKKIKRLDVKYHGLDIAFYGNRFAIDTTSKEMSAKLLNKDIMQERNSTITNSILKIFNAKKASINIIGLLHIAEIQKLLIQELGEKTVVDNFVFILPDYKSLIKKLQDKGNLEAFPLPVIKIDSDPEKKFLFRKILSENCFDNKNYFFDEEISSDSDELENSKTRPCCGLISGIFNFFKQPSAAENYKVATKILPDKKMN